MSDDTPPDPSSDASRESPDPSLASSPDSSPEGIREWLTWLRRTDHGAVVFAREVASSALMVAVVGLVLFGASGVWPPMVAVESGSMEPHMERGDLVFLMDEGRLAPAYATGETGVVTYRVGKERGFRKSGSYGDVIVYRPDGREETTPIIHRARFWVNDSENWYRKANPKYLAGDNCAEVTHCPAPNAGFVTLGDNNELYDQAVGRSRPVRPSWVRGTAELTIPELGHVRLAVSGN
ncbi:S26 family signal peptidase [Halorussus gelatinilyticus]|uniref:S26 family signal peptidase n=1 Tax=Halorussus gelatinilyticus TaxID=2937524 RepID=A0A8U0IG09_9EURY|nr:S26 family signal peptidase [Halorussus gelatinilyticus]UPW00020.1 S26 family signal peptidase [Halorussus gelatinilyticus]